jgi:uncharacterized protein (TIGR03792 family)
VPDAAPTTLEILRFRVPPGRADDFVARNERLWTPALREMPGFLGRSIVRGEEDPDEVTILVRWRDRADMDAFPRERMAELDRRMADLVVEKRRWFGAVVTPEAPP